MTALSADRALKTAGQNPLSTLSEFPIAASTTVYRGAALSVDGGYCKPVSATAHGAPFLGIASDQGVAVAAGSATVDVLRPECVEFAIASAAATDIGQPVWFSDDNTVTFSSGAIYAGLIEDYVDSTHVMVRCHYGWAPNTVKDFSATLGATAANTTYLFAGFLNPNGAYVLDTFGVITTDHAGAGEDQAVYTFYDSADGAIGTAISIADSSADDVGDFRLGKRLSEYSAGDALPVVAAGRGYYVKVSQLTSGSGAAGGMRCVARVLFL